MIKYEYKVVVLAMAISVGLAEYKAVVEAALNPLGEAGWRLMDSKTNWYLLMREVPE